MSTERKRTDSGFQFGAARVECWAADEKRGSVVVGITTPKQVFQFYVTKTGKVRIYTNGFEVLHGR